MRQKAGSELSFVSLTQGPNTVVTFAAGVNPGVYSLVLESFDTAVTDSPVVKTETLAITVHSYTRSSPIKVTHEVTTANPESLFIEDPVITPVLGTGNYHVKLASSSDL